MEPIQMNVNFSENPIAFPHFFNAFGYANCDYTYTKASRKLYRHLASIGRDFYYMRLHNILTAHGDGDLYILTEGQDYGNPDVGAGRWVDKVFTMKDGKLACDWTYVDQIYDIILENGGRPIVETHFIPSCIQSADYFIPRDYNLWAEVLILFVNHCIERYGRDEVRQWYFEVWNEPDNHLKWVEDPSTFFAFYDYFEYAIHSVDPEIKVGGPAVKQWEGAEKLYRAFLEHCAYGLNYKSGTFGTRIDFVSVHCKAGYPQDTNPNSNVMFEWVRRYSAIMQEFPEFKDTEFFNDESDIVWDGNLGVWMKSWLNFRNTHYPAGITCKMMTKYCDLVMDEWKVNLKVVDSDNCHTPWERYLYSGNRSQLTPLVTRGTDDLIKKPLFNAYILLNRLGNTRFKAACDAEGFGDKFGILPTSHEGGYAVMVWNFEDGMEDDINPRTVELKLDGLKAGRYNLTHYRIDETHSSSYHIWNGFGRPEAPTPEQVQAMREHEGLELFEDVQEMLLGSSYTANVALPMHAVSLLLLTPVNANAPAVPQALWGISEESFGGNGQVFLQWAPNREYDFGRYTILRSEDGSAFAVLSDSGTNNISAYTDMTVQKGKSYTYRVQANNCSGAVSAPSEPIIINV